jgi:hypothetical protein
MTNIVKFGTGLPANAEDLAKNLQTMNQNLVGSSGGMPFLRLLKSGLFAYGAEKIEPEEGSQWAVNPFSLCHGFAAWGDGELLDERMVPFNQTPPLRSELPDYGQPWNQQVSMQLQCLTGEDKSIVVMYKGTSTGLRNATKKLIDEIISQAQIDPDHIVPVVQLEVDSYEHKKYGEIFVPLLEVERWININNGQAAAAESAPEAERKDEPNVEPEQAATSEPEPEKPRRRRRKKTEAVATSEAEAEPEKPARRRRRAKA